MVGKAWGQECVDSSHTASAGRRWEGVPVVGLLFPFPLFDSVLPPSPPPPQSWDGTAYIQGLPSSVQPPHTGVFPR